MSAAQIISAVSLTSSTVIVVLLGYGIARRHVPRIHVPVMSTCFAVDLLNVVLIEVSRLAGVFGTGEGEGPVPAAAAGGAEGEEGAAGSPGAVERSVRGLAEGDFDLLDFHVLVSVLVLAGYGVAIATGRRLLREGRGRRVHRTNAGIFVVCRLANWVTAFMV